MPRRCLCNKPVNLFSLAQPSPISRRRLLGGSLAAGAGLAAMALGSRTASANNSDPKHLVWVWQWNADAEPQVVAPKLRDNGLAVAMKTHDGLEWMSKYDKSRYAVSGPAQVATLAKYFEDAGVPFHAWAVVKNEDKMAEARMAADVLKAGARSLIIDLEPGNSFWVGPGSDALAYGKELKRLAPGSKISLSIDARPWMMTKLPIKEFASFSDEILPQSYWRTFNTQANYEKFAQAGYPVPPEGITPEFLVTVTNKVLAPLGLPIRHVGQGATTDVNEFRRFMNVAQAGGSDTVSVWRYGVTGKDVFSLLRDLPPRRAAAPPPAAAVAPAQLTANGTYIVQEGDSLSIIAQKLNVKTDDLIAINGLQDATVIYIGQELKVPGGPASVSDNAPRPVEGAQVSYTTSSGKTHNVESGDTISGIAAQYNVGLSDLVRANGLEDADMLAVGQVLKIP
jgi:LysM repeat protein